MSPLTETSATSARVLTGIGPMGAILILSMMENRVWAGLYGHADSGVCLVFSGCEGLTADIYANSLIIGQSHYSLSPDALKDSALWLTAHGVQVRIDEEEEAENLQLKTFKGVVIGGAA